MMANFYVKSLLTILLISIHLYTNAQDKKIMLLEIKDEINPTMSRYVQLGLDEANKQKADLVIVELDTYGGAVHDADKIRTLIIEYKKPVYAFINDNAASAGSLISIACDSIYMSPGASIGASTVVDQDGKSVSDKFQSYMKSKMRSTAEANGRDPKIAEAFVGDSIAKDSKVLTLSTKEAIKLNYCDGEVNTVDEILKLNHISNYKIITYEMSWLDKFESYFLNPYVRSILILLILAGIYFEMQHPGIGFPLLVSIVASLLYFVPSYLHGFAQYWEIALFVLGIILLLLEIFVIPGFGIAGIAGIVLTLSGLLLVMLDNNLFDFSMVGIKELAEALTVLFVGIVGGVIFLIIGGRQFLKSNAFKKLTLQEELKTSDGYTSNFLKNSMIGKVGKAHTVLRPSGKIMVDGELYDAFSRNEFIEEGSEIVVIDESTNSLKVKRHN